jgi:hypothetical protein
MGTADRLPCRVLGVAVLLAAVLGSHHARASDAAPRPPPRFAEEPPSRWYGWQTLATDGAAVGLISASLATVDNGRNSPSSALAWGALGVYALGAPVMHFVHENPGRGLASFGMRVGGPIVLGFTGAVLEDCGGGGGDFCGLGGALIGTSLGIIGAVAVDAAVFAYDDQPENQVALRGLRIGFGPRGAIAFGDF